MPNRPHAARDCDDDCRGCSDCYLATGDGACTWLCPHRDEHHGDELTHDAYCECEGCQMERARDTAEEPCRD